MKNLIKLFSILFVMSLFVTSNAFGQDEPSKKQEPKKKMEKTCEKGCCESKAKEKCESKAKEKGCCKSEAKAEKKDEAKIWNKFCPVRGNEVDVETATVKYDGKNIGFCCPGCDKKFNKDPKAYLKNLSKDGKKFIGKS